MITVLSFVFVLLFFLVLVLYAVVMLLCVFAASMFAGLLDLCGWAVRLVRRLARCAPKSAKRVRFAVERYDVGCELAADEREKRFCEEFFTKTSDDT